MDRVEKLKKRLAVFLYLYGVLLVFVSAFFVGLASEPGDQSLYVALLWIAYGVAYALLWAFIVES